MDDHEILILLNQKMDSVLETLKQLPKLEERVCTLEKSDGVKTEQIQTMKTDLTKVGAVNFLAVLIGTALGISIK